MITEQINIDFTEIKEKRSKNAIKGLIEDKDFHFSELYNFWYHFEKDENDVIENAIVFIDLYSLIKHLERINKERWTYKVKKSRPYFISIIRNKRDERVAVLIDNLLKISDNRLTVIKATHHFSKSKDRTVFLDEFNKIIERNFTPNALKKVAFNKVKESFIVEFNDDVYGEITLKELGIQDLKEQLLLESAQISEHGNALEIFTQEGEIFDIDALVLKSMLSKESKDEIDKETKLTAQNVGARIKSVRKKLKITQKELAKATDIDQAIISKIETGKHLPRVDTIERIANGLGVTMSQLLVSK
jgi:DNA-binding XRE family transcriptional regulator